MQGTCVGGLSASLLPMARHANPAGRIIGIGRPHARRPGAPRACGVDPARHRALFAGQGVVVILPPLLRIRPRGHVGRGTEPRGAAINACQCWRVDCREGRRPGEAGADTPVRQPHNRGPHEVRTHLGSGNPDPGSGWGAALSSPARWRCCRRAHGPDHMRGVIELSVALRRAPARGRRLQAPRRASMVAKTALRCFHPL
jgi:hypothetical protein